MPLISRPDRPSEDPDTDPESDHALLLGIAVHVASFEGWAKRLDGQFLEWTQRNAAEHEQLCQRLSGLEQRRSERLALPVMAMAAAVAALVGVGWLAGSYGVGSGSAACQRDLGALVHR
jgi:hypothetical protein